MAVWLSGNVLASINIVALRQTRLVPGWVTICGRVKHSQYVTSQLARLGFYHPWDGKMSISFLVE